MGTVGAVAVDIHGNVACATSTGGILNKMEGRVGDTPCIGRSVQKKIDSSQNNKRHFNHADVATYAENTVLRRRKCHR